MFLASELGKKKEMENLLEVCLVDHCASQRQTLVVAFKANWERNSNVGKFHELAL